MAAALRRIPGLSLLPRTLFSTLASSSSLDKPLTNVRAVKSAIRSESDPERIAALFTQSSDCPAFRHDRTAFALSVRKLAKAGRLDLVEQILELQKSFPSTRSEGFWVRLISLYSEHGMVDQAVRTFDQMQAELGCQLTDKSLCALLGVFLHNRDFDRLHQAFAELPDRTGVVPGVASHNVVLTAFCKAKAIDSARSLLEEMEDKDVTPNIVSYNIMLGAYFRVGDEAKFNAIVQRIGERGLNPNVVTFNHRLLHLCSNKESSRARELLDEMVGEGFEPNAVSFNAVIIGFCKEGKLDMARSVYESLCSSKSACPNPLTYLTLISHFVEAGEFDAGLEMCKESLKRKWVPPFPAMEGLVKGLVKMSKVEEAKDVVERMKRMLQRNAVDAWAKVEGHLPL